jgi:hypothetical protein
MQEDSAALDESSKLADGIAQRAPIPESEQWERIRLGYEKAIDLWMGVTQEIWSRFNAYLVANSILVAVAAGLLAASRPLTLVTVTLCFMGLALAALWWGLFDRGFGYLYFYTAAARELEEEHFERYGVHTVTGGWALTQPGGAQLRLRTGHERHGTHHKISGFGRCIPNLKGMRLVIGLFCVLYVVIVVVSLGLV